MLHIGLINQYGTDNFCFISLTRYEDYETGMTRKALQFIVFGLGFEVALISYYE